jgi:hypothetical protein
MASTINASTTGLGSIVTTADNSGIIALQANGVTAMTANSAAGSALVALAGTTSNEAVKLTNAAEAINIVASAPSATQNFYVASGAVQYFTTNAANNWIFNLVFSSGTSLNNAMAVGDCVTVTMLTTQGSTAYYNSAIYIDGTGSGITTYWQGGTAPTSGNASGIDVYTYAVIKTASATYTVLASQTQF